MRPGAGRHARAAGGGGRGAVLHRRHRGGRRRARERAGRDADARRPRGLRGDPARADPRRLPRPRGVHEPAAVGGRDPHRLRARAAAGRARAADRVAPDRGDGGGAPRAHAGVPRGARPARLPRGVPGLAPRLDDAHLRARRRGAGVRGDVHERRGLGRDRAGHRHPPQQHAGRGGPLAAGLLHPPAGAAAAVDDGADGRGARGRGDARARLGGVEPDPLGDPAGDRRA